MSGGLQPLSGEDLMHPINDANETRLLPSYNVFAEQEKAFFKQGTNGAIPRGASHAGHPPRPSSSQSSTAKSTSPQTSPSSSASRPTYSNVPPYRTATTPQPNQTSNPSNQFGVLVPGWGSAQDPRTSGCGGSEGQDGMQFVPVATKGSGAPGRGPTKRKKV